MTTTKDTPEVRDRLVRIARARMSRRVSAMLTDEEIYSFIAAAEKWNMDPFVGSLANEADRILSRIGQALRDGGEPSLYAKMDTGETIADAIEAYLAKAEAT